MGFLNPAELSVLPEVTHRHCFARGVPWSRLALENRITPDRDQYERPHRRVEPMQLKLHEAHDGGTAIVRSLSSVIPFWKWLSINKQEAHYGTWN